MHEVPIVRDILHTLQAHYADKLDRVTKVQVEAGLLCNIQPLLIQSALEAVILEEKRFSNIDLEVVLLPVVAFCAACDKAFEVKASRFICSCGAASLKIIQGEELRISQVEYLAD